MKVAVMIDEYGKTQAAVTTDGGDPSAKLSSRFLGSGPVAIHVFESSVSLPRPKTKRVRTKKITGDQYNDEDGGDEINETLGRLGIRGRK